MNCELPDVQAGFSKSRGSRDQIANIRWIIKKAKELQKNTYFCFMPKLLTVWITTNWKILKEMGIPDHLTHLLRNLYAGQEATVRTGHGTTDCFQIGKGVHQGCILSPCLFNFYAELVMPSNYLILYCPLLLLPSIFPAPGSFQVSQFFVSGDKNIGVSTSTSVLPMNIQDWFSLGWIG